MLKAIIFQGKYNFGNMGGGGGGGSNNTISTCKLTEETLKSDWRIKHKVADLTEQNSK